MTSIPQLTPGHAAGIAPTIGAEAVGHTQLNPSVEKAIAVDGGPKFTSPTVHFDASTGIEILQYVDSSTGDVNYQFPSKLAVQEYARHAVDDHGPASSANSKKSEA